jgi:hypothetical protein
VNGLILRIKHKLETNSSPAKIEGVLSIVCAKMSSTPKRKSGDGGDAQRSKKKRASSGRPTDPLRFAQQYLKREIDSLPVGEYYSLPLDLTQYQRNDSICHGLRMTSILDLLPAMLYANIVQIKQSRKQNESFTLQYNSCGVDALKNTYKTLSIDTTDRRPRGDNKATARPIRVRYICRISSKVKPQPSTENPSEKYRQRKDLTDINKSKRAQDNERLLSTVATDFEGYGDILKLFSLGSTASATETTNVEETSSFPQSTINAGVESPTASPFTDSASTDATQPESSQSSSSAHGVESPTASPLVKRSTCSWTTPAGTGSKILLTSISRT